MVLFQGEAAKSFHKKLFSLDEGSYLSAEREMPRAILRTAKEDVFKLHVVAGWETLLAVALWTDEPPSRSDVISLLRGAGATGEELTPFREAEINDIFLWLYYSRKFDILRKVCNAARAKAESRIGSKAPRVNCHLVWEEAGGIVASSL
jgi:hypothetical protein